MYCYTRRYSVIHIYTGLYLTNRFQVAVRLFSNRSQMTSKCGKNKKVAHEAQPSVSLMFLPHFDVLCDLLLNRAIQGYTHLYKAMYCYTRQYSVIHIYTGLYLTNTFQVAVRLFSNRSQRTSKRGKNKKVAHEAQPSVSLMFLQHFDVLCDLLLNRRTGTWNLFVLYNKKLKYTGKNAFLFQISPLCRPRK